MTMKSKAAVKRIIETLKGLYPDALCSLQYEKDYELLFAVRLSAQCTDERVNKVTPALYERFPTLESFAQADPAEVGEYIHSCGFYNGKARDIVACAQQLPARLRLRHPLHPHHRAAGHHRWVQGSRPGGTAAAQGTAAGGVLRFLPPDGALRPGYLYRPLPQV